MIKTELLALILFGAQWLPSVPILQVLGLGGLIWPLHVLNLNILKALVQAMCGPQPNCYCIEIGEGGRVEKISLNVLGCPT